MFICSISEDDVTLNFEGNQGDLFDGETKEIKPTPLTEEWLLKFGFEKADKLQNDIYLHPKVPVYGVLKQVDEDGKTIFRMFFYEGEFSDATTAHFLTAIPHVHKLQNLWLDITYYELTTTNPQPATEQN